MIHKQYIMYGVDPQKRRSAPQLFWENIYFYNMTTAATKCFCFKSHVKTFKFS